MHRFLKHKLTAKVVIDQIQPLRVLFYVHLVSFAVPSLHMGPESALFLFNSVFVLVIANIGFIVFIEYEKLRKRGLRLSILWLLVFFTGLLAVEFLGVAVHTLTSFKEHDDLQVIHWNTISLLFTGMGGFLLPITNYVGERLDEKIKLTKKQGKIISVLLLGIAIAINIYSIQVNQTWKNILNYFSGLF